MAQSSARVRQWTANPGLGREQGSMAVAWACPAHQGGVELQAGGAPRVQLEHRGIHLPGGGRGSLWRRQPAAAGARMGARLRSTASRVWARRMQRAREDGGHHTTRAMQCRQAASAMLASGAAGSTRQSGKASGAPSCLPPRSRWRSALSRVSLLSPAAWVQPCPGATLRWGTPRAKQISLTGCQKVWLKWQRHLPFGHLHAC